MKKNNMKNNQLIQNRDWKEKDKNYLKELQIFFDRADNVADDELKNSIIRQMLRCDNALTEVSENMFIKYYEKGYNEAKKA